MPGERLVQEGPRTLLAGRTAVVLAHRLSTVMGVDRALAYALGTKAVGTLNVEFYTGVDERLPDPVVLPPLLDTAALHGLRALLVDDVADTGETLALVQRLMVAHCGEVRTAVLYAKSHSVVDPDFVWRRTDQWITFPWAALPPVTA